MESHINKYKLNQKGKEYILKLSIIGDSLRLTCHSILNQSIKFTRDLTLEDLKQLDKIFFSIQTSLEALKCIDKTLRNQKVKVSQNSEVITLQFYFESESQVQTELPLTEQVTTTTNEIISDYNYQNIGLESANYTEGNFDTGVDMNNYNITTGTEETANIQDFQNLESNQAQTGGTFAYNEYQSTQEVNIPTTENYQVPTNEINTITNAEYTTTTQEKTLYAPPYISPVEEDTVETQNIPTTENIITTNENNYTNENTNYLINENQQYQTQSNELENLKQKINEIDNTKNQLNEIQNLRHEFEQIAELKKKLNELNNLRNEELEENELKKRIKQLEKIIFEQNQEIFALREKQAEEIERRARSKNISQGMESRQLYFEEQPEQICVKGDIIHNAQELELVSRKINKSSKKLTLNLLYKATADSDKAEAFHKKCDKAQSTLVLIETDKGKRFGGFTKYSWEGECIEKKDEDAFVFSLDKMMTYDNIPGEDTIGCYPKFGPIFMGCQIRIYDNAFSKGGTTFEKGMNYNTEEDYELTGGERVFGVKEIEVYEVVPS